MIRHTSITFIAACIVFTLGCSHSRQNLENSHFLTRISGSGLKHFELRIRGVKEAQKRPTGERRQRERQHSGNSEKHYEKTLIAMRKIAEEKIEENRYCREGFWVLDFDIDTRGPFLRGECNDLASTGDKTGFPDTIKNW